MTALLEALERARIDFDFAPLAQLLRSGYRPTDDEWNAFADFTFDKRRRDARKRVITQGRAMVRYKELRSAKYASADAIQKVADEFSLHTLAVKDVIRGKNSAVNRLVAAWARRGIA